MPTPFIKLPIGSITPKGWLRQQLQLEADGMTGSSRRDFAVVQIRRQCLGLGRRPRATAAGKNLPYWLKGYGDFGYVLKDEKIIHEARRWIDAMLSSQEPDG